MALWHWTAALAATTQLSPDAARARGHGRHTLNKDGVARHDRLHLGSRNSSEPSHGPGHHHRHHAAHSETRRVERGGAEAGGVRVARSESRRIPSSRVGLTSSFGTRDAVGAWQERGGSEHAAPLSAGASVTERLSASVLTQKPSA